MGGFFLPSRCLVCAGVLERFFEGAVCRPCWKSLPVPDARRCLVCDEPLPGEEADRCGRCLLDPPAFRSLRAAAPYRGSAREILVAFKFRGADFLARRLASVMAERLRLSDPVQEVVPVPGAASILRRQDHAAETLAAAVAAELGATFRPGRLVKVRRTLRQSGLPAVRRATNVRNAFRARSGEARSVLLVDDVATSCATARECAAALRKAGAEAVDVWCFARASRDALSAAAFAVRSAESPASRDGSSE